MKKELRPVHDVVACDVCGRTILKGEYAEAYLAPGGHRYQVCDLCSARAQHHGWIRESAAGDMPAFPRAEPRRGLLGRLRRRPPPEPPAQAPTAAPPEPGEREASLVPEDAIEPRELEERSAPAPAPPPRPRPNEPRHVRAVPTTPEAKVERALDLFNGSQHQRTIAGLARTLGTPFVCAHPDAEQASEVSVVVAWELSWYRYRVDLGDEADPVVLLDKGEELQEIDASLREWNATLAGDGRVLSGADHEPPAGG